MKFTDDFDMEKYKQPAVFSLFFILLAGIFYFLIFSKISKMMEMDERITNEKIKLKKYTRTLKTMENNLKIHKNRYAEQLEIAEKMESERKKKDFPTGEALERYVSAGINSNFLTLTTIARAETRKESNRVYFPYKISGKCDNLLEFIEEMETGEKNISFSETPFKIKFDTTSVFDGKIAADITNFKEKVESHDEKTAPLYKINGKTVNMVKVVPFNMKNYIFIYYTDGSSELITENSQIKSEGKTGRITVENGRIYLQK